MPNCFSLLFSSKQSKEKQIAFWVRVRGPKQKHRHNFLPQDQKNPCYLWNTVLETHFTNFFFPFHRFVRNLTNWTQKMESLTVLKNYIEKRDTERLTCDCIFTYFCLKNVFSNSILVIQAWINFLTGKSPCHSYFC